MKKLVFILFMIAVCLISLGNEFQNIQYDLTELYYDQDIISTGIDHSYDFYFPVVYSDQIQEGLFTFNYEMTQIAGLKSMYVVMINGTPIRTDYFQKYKGQLVVSIPTELFESEPLIQITIHITLDYPVCDQSRVNKNALWFRVKKDSFLTYSYLEKDIEQIPLFLSSQN